MMMYIATVWVLRDVPSATSHGVVLEPWERRVFRTEATDPAQYQALALTTLLQSADDRVEFGPIGLSRVSR
jgi:hypothetical protein